MDKSEEKREKKKSQVQIFKLTFLTKLTTFINQIRYKVVLVMEERRERVVGLNLLLTKLIILTLTFAHQTQNEEC